MTRVFLTCSLDGMTNHIFENNAREAGPNENARMPRYGSKTHHDHHKQITEIAAMHTIRRIADCNSWSNDVSLRQICIALDQHRISIPARWATGRTDSLRRVGVHLNGW